MEIPSIVKLLKTKKTDSQSAGSLTINPGKLSKVSKLANPMQQRLSLTTYTPPNYLKDVILQIYQQMKRTYGKLPLWIDYSMFPLSVSWNLGSMQANHNLLIYGAKEIVEEFSSMFQETIQKSNLNNSVIENTFAKEIEPIQVSKIEPLSSAVTKEKGSSTSNGMVGSLGAIAGIIGVALAISMLKKREKKQINREKALDLAIAQVGELIPNQPILQGEKFCMKKWEFIISGYQVFVNKFGIVEKISKIGVQK